MDRAYWYVGPLRVVTNETTLDAHYVVVRGTKIERICSEVALPREAKQLVCPRGVTLFPGMIDQHIHGLGGVDVMDAMPEALQTISQALAQYGVTSFLATTMTASSHDIEQALHVCATTTVHGAKLLGVHLEGPFIHKQQKGAQAATHIIAPSRARFQQFQRAAQHTIRLVTLAPETDTDGLLDMLQQQHIVASIGHSNATFEEAQAALPFLQSATHFFNGMRSMHHRAPSLQASLLLSEAMIEVIADGHHVHPAMLQLLYQIVGCNRLILVSDSMRAMGMPNGTYDLGGQAVIVEDGMCMLANGHSLAGSVLHLHAARMNMKRWLALSDVELAKITATNSATLLGYGAQKGQIRTGYDADFYIVDADDHVLLTVREGQLIFKRKEA